MVAAAYYWLRLPAVHHVKVTALRKYLEVLLRRGLQGGVMLVRPASGSGGQERYIQFAKYIRTPGSIGIELAFPLSPWSEAYYPVLREALQHRDIYARIERTKRADTPEFLNIDFGADLAKADGVAHLILHDIFQLSPESTVRVTFENVSPKDELVDR